MNLVDEAVRNFELLRAGTITELENIPEQHWDYRPDPGARTLRDLARHVSESSVVFASELTRPDTAFLRVHDPQARAEAMKGYPRADSRAELIDLARRTGADVARRMREIGEPLASQPMATRGGEQSKLSGLWFAIGHEMYHRGQVTAYARGLGLTPVLTQQTRAMQGAKA